MQFLRFMAMEAAGPEKSSSALSWILIGGVPAAILGPLLGLWGRDLGPVAFSGSFGLLLGVLAVQALLVASLPAGHSSGHGTVGDEPSRPWRQRLADPRALVGLDRGGIQLRIDGDVDGCNSGCHA